MQNYRLQYETLPSGGVRRNYTDSADTGADFMASVNYVEHKGVAYVTDILYTQKLMEYTGADAAQSLKSFRREGRNAHDDIEDVLTGIVENLVRGSGKNLGGFFF